jgi:hypothetical protein
MAGGPVIFASDASPEALADAKSYIARFNLTKDDVALVVRGGQTIVIAKRNIADKIRADYRPITPST